MNFASLSSTLSGDGEIFYAPIEQRIGSNDIRDVIVVIKGNKDFSIKGPDGSPLEHVPKYRIEVNRITWKCSINSSAITKSEYFDESNNLVFINNLIHRTSSGSLDSIKWQQAKEDSPFGVLSRIICPSEFGGLGVQVGKDGSLIKVMHVVAGTPAQKGGMSVNDVITHLDDVSVDGLLAVL